MPTNNRLAETLTYDGVPYWNALAGNRSDVTTENVLAQVLANQRGFGPTPDPFAESALRAYLDRHGREYEHGQRMDALLEEHRARRAFGQEPERVASDVPPEPNNDAIDYLRSLAARMPTEAYPWNPVNVWPALKSAAESGVNWLDASAQAAGQRQRTEYSPVGPAEMLVPPGTGMIASALTGIPRNALSSTAALAGRAVRAPARGLTEDGIMGAKRQAYISDPPTHYEQRPFHEDYPSGAKSDASGRLTESIEGAPLTAPYVVGRTQLGQGDQGLRGQDIWDLAPRLVEEVRPARRGELGPDEVGRYYPSQVPEIEPRQIVYHGGMNAGDKTRVVAHETGHAIDDMIGFLEIRAKNDPTIRKQLEQVFSDMAPARLGMADNAKVLPKDLGYSAAEEYGELAAEFIRAYKTNPNYVKSVAPDVAKLVRVLANENPGVKKGIQFNALAPWFPPTEVGGLNAPAQAQENAGEIRR